MSVNSETADQTVKMTLEAIEEAAKISASIGGTSAKSLAAMIYAIITDNKKSRGKTRLTAMLKSGKELKVLALNQKDLKQFCDVAKKYGVLYCVLKEKDNKDGIVDIMIRAEDASKVSRIVDKFELASIDTKAIRASVLNQEKGDTDINNVDLNDSINKKKSTKRNQMQDKVCEQDLKKSKLKEKTLEKSRVGEDMNRGFSKKSVKKELRAIQNKIVNNSSRENFVNKTRIKRKER